MSDIAALVANNLDIWTGAIERKSRAGRGGGGKRISLYGIEQLRALIFDLAAAGKLITGPTSQAEKLGKHVDLVMGQAPPGNACNTNGDGTIFVKTGEFGQRYPEIREWTTKPLKLAKSGDVLICVVGATIGKLNLAIDCAIGRSVAAIRPKPSLDTNYLYYALMPFTLRLRVGARGSAQGVIGKAELNAVSIRVPPLAEQRRIVAKVDELMALCDALERESADALAAHQTLAETLLATLANSADATDLAANWARLESHFDTLFTTEASIDALKQTILDLAVRGKLVEQIAADGAASDLLKRIIASNAKRVAAGGAKKMRSQSGTPSGMSPFDVPPSWVWTSLDRIAYKLTDGAHHTPTYTDEGVPFLSVKDMSSGTLDFSDTRFISAEQHTELYRRCDAERGDLLITKVGTTGVPVIVDTDQPFSLFVSVALVKAPWELVSVEYLRLLVDSPFVRRQSAEGTQGIGNKNLVLRTIGAFQIPFPPLAEQHRIVAKVDEFMTLCDALKARFSDAAETRRHLADAIIERAAA